MALLGHHAGSGASAAAAAPFVAEKDALVGSILGFPGGGGHAATINAVGAFLRRFHDAGGIPWVRLYQSFPAWQQQCGLLNQDWDRDAVLEGAKVVFTLLDPHGVANRRKALGGGTWKSTGAETMGPSQVVLSKLYYKSGGGGVRDGFTTFEFRLTMELQPRVAICVLHPTNYRHIIRDLRRYIHQGYFPGGDQASLPVVQQHLPPVYSGSHQPYVAGFMNGPHAYYTTNPASNSERNILGASQSDQVAVQHEGQYLAHNIAGFTNGSQLHYSSNSGRNSESFGSHLSAGIQMNIPSNTYPMNDDMYSMPWETNIFGGQHSHADEMSIRNTSIGNSAYAITPIHDAMVLLPCCLHFMEFLISKIDEQDFKHIRK